MGERAHTPGPWRAVKASHGPIDIFDSQSRDIVTVYGGGVGSESKVANARLISAAPDMFEALKAALPVLEAVQRQYAVLAKSKGMGGDGPVLEAVRLAIAKAAPSESSGRNRADANSNPNTSPLYGESGR